MEQRKTTLTDGSPVTDDHREIISDGPRAGQQKAYVVLSEEERAKGFIRPYRDSYIHVGKKLRGELEMLDQPSESPVLKKTYVALDRFYIGEGDNRVRTGSYMTQEEVDQIKRTGRYGGCGAKTTMGRSIAETYARDPSFYGGTFCCGCGSHHQLSEFVWEGTDEQVGS